MAAATVTNDHVHVVRGYVAAPHVAIIVIFAVKGTDVRFCHCRAFRFAFIPYTAHNMPSANLKKNII